MKELHKSPLYRAALKVGISEKTARKYVKLKRLTNGDGTTLEKPSHRTRKNPFETHWPWIETMLTQSPQLQAQTLLTHLREHYPGHYKQGQIRTLQRHLKMWRAHNGTNKSVIFRQRLIPGRQSQSDWTHMKELNITLNGEPFPHLLFHFILPYSGFETVMICKTESFESLSQGFEQGVLEIGGVALEHRTDNLTAATQQLGKGRIFTQRWTEFLAHYQVQPSRNNPGVSHENGSVEKSHHLFKNAVDQHLMLRQSRDFKSLQAYQEFLDTIKAKRNFAKRDKINEEVATLKELPEKGFNEVTMISVRVTPSSTIQIMGVTYSVPSRLIAYTLKAMVYRQTIDLFYGQKSILTLPRLTAGVLINYRHIIDSLLRKPGAFDSYQYKACLYPTPVFRKAYDLLQESGIIACHKKYLEILHIAKLYGEEAVSLALKTLFEAKVLPVKDKILELLPAKKEIQDVIILEPLLADYDQLSGFKEKAS